MTDGFVQVSAPDVGGWVQVPDVCSVAEIKITVTGDVAAAGGIKQLARDIEHEIVELQARRGLVLTAEPVKRTVFARWSARLGRMRAAW